MSTRPSVFPGAVVFLAVCAAGCGPTPTEPTLSESLTTKAWAVTAYKTGGIERIEVGDGCLNDDVYTFEDGGVARLNAGAKSCPANAAGIFPHQSEGTWTLDETGGVRMAFTSATRSDCVLTFTASTLAAGTLWFAFSQPCTNTVATMQVTAQ